MCAAQKGKKVTSITTLDRQREIDRLEKDVEELRRLASTDESEEAWQSSEAGPSPSSGTKKDATPNSASTAISASPSRKDIARRCASWNSPRNLGVRF